MSSQIDLINKPNCYTIIAAGNTPFVLEALGDRVIIQEDRYKTGYECKVCDGLGELVCASCNGSGVSRINPDIKCKDCNDTQEIVFDEAQKTSPTARKVIGSGRMVCMACRGKGASVVVPEESVRRPTSGVIKSVGPDVDNANLSIGTRVIYAIFAGTAIEFKGVGTCRILHENEIMGIIYGTANLGDIVK